MGVSFSGWLPSSCVNDDEDNDDDDDANNNNNNNNNFIKSI